MGHSTGRRRIRVRRVDGVVEMRVMSSAGMVMNQGTDLIPKDSANGTNGRNIILVTHTVGQQPVPNLPGEYTRVFLFQFFDICNYFRRRNPRLASSYSTRQDGAGLVVSSQDFGNASVRHS